jgi:adenylosuccinate synthase
MKLFITVDLGFGDSGKGTMVDYLCKTHNADWIVRYNGGAQCGHNVQDGDFKHCFSQFGSGSQRPNVRTYISPYVRFNPISLIDEAMILANKGVSRPLDRVWIDPETPIITPFHVWANRAREMARGEYKHGSCGKGIGELGADLHFGMNDIIRAKELHDCYDKLKSIQIRKNAELDVAGIVKRNPQLTDPDQPEQIATAYREMGEILNIGTPEIKGTTIFEGAQGVLLDEWVGFHPYTTWSTILPMQPSILCPALGIDTSKCEELETIGILRTYMTRHGVGPLPTETKNTNIWHHDECNCTNKWQDHFRFGWADLVLWHYAISCCNRVLPIRFLAITHCDIFDHQFIQICNGYKDIETDDEFGGIQPPDELIPEEQTIMTQKLLHAWKPIYGGDFTDADDAREIIQANLECNVKYMSFGPDVSQKKALDIPKRI